MATSLGETDEQLVRLQAVARSLPDGSDAIFALTQYFEEVSTVSSVAGRHGAHIRDCRTCLQTRVVDDDGCSSTRIRKDWVTRKTGDGLD